MADLDKNKRGMPGLGWSQIGRCSNGLGSLIQHYEYQEMGGGGRASNPIHTHPGTTSGTLLPPTYKDGVILQRSPVKVTLAFANQSIQQCKNIDKIFLTNCSWFVLLL